MIRVLIVDDHQVVREGLRTILEAAGDLDLIGEAADGADAIRLVAELHPDVILMDLRMPGVDGIEAIRTIKAAGSTAEIVILTTYDDDELILRGLRAGARGYLLKDTDRTELFEAVRAAQRGELLLSPEVANTVLTHLDLPEPDDDILSAREREVLDLMAQGAPNKQIAARLQIAERTVKAHVTNIFNKVGAGSRTEAVAIALKRGLLDH